MQTLKFNYRTCLSSPNTSGRCSVVIRVTYESNRKNLSTGIALLPKQWDKSRERVKQGCTVLGIDYNILNDRISEEQNFIIDYFNQCGARKVSPSLKELADRYNYRFRSNAISRATEFFYLYDEFISETSKVNAWTKATFDVHQRMRNKIEAYKPDICFADLSTSTMERIKVMLSQTMFNEAIDKHLSYLKQFVTWSQKKGYRINEEYFQYNHKLPKGKRAVKFLDKNEIGIIYNLELTEGSILDQTRDFFIFQCETALRYSDLKNLKHENIIPKNGEKGVFEIDILTEKDDDRIYYRLSKRATKIYLKYKKFQYEDNKVFPVLSNQKYNKHLKELGKVANLKGEWIDYEYRLSEKIIVRTPKNELTTHIPRRTFITTAYNEGISLEQIASISSHSDYNAMKPYLKANSVGTDKVIDVFDNLSDNNIDED